jgi:hypothetical protein
MVDVSSQPFPLSTYHTSRPLADSARPRPESPSLHPTASSHRFRALNFPRFLAPLLLPLTTLCTHSTSLFARIPDNCYPYPQVSDTTWSASASSPRHATHAISFQVVTGQPTLTISASRPGSLHGLSTGRHCACAVVPAFPRRHRPHLSLLLTPLTSPTYSFYICNSNASATEYTLLHLILPFDFDS